MFLKVEPVSELLDWVFEASNLLQPSHDGKALQWFAKNKHCFFYAPKGGPQYTGKLVGFNGSEAMELRGGYSNSGPHTFVLVGTFRTGVFLDVSDGPIRLQPRGTGVKIIEWQSDCPINGETFLGSTCDRKDYFKGELSFFGYKKGLLTERQKAYLGDLLGAAYQPTKLKWYQTLLQLGGIYV